jgi:hypothetical protein
MRIPEVSPRPTVSLLTFSLTVHSRHGAAPAAACTRRAACARRITITIRTWGAGPHASGHEGELRVAARGSMAEVSGLTSTSAGEVWPTACWPWAPQARPWAIMDGTDSQALVHAAIERSRAEATTGRDCTDMTGLWCFVYVFIFPSASLRGANHTHLHHSSHCR